MAQKHETLRMNASDPDYEAYAQMVRDLHIATNPHLWAHSEDDRNELGTPEMRATPEKIKSEMEKFHIPLIGALFDFARKLR